MAGSQQVANPQDARFADSFLIVRPGITIRDRLRVLLPNDPQNYYKALDILPLDRTAQLEQAKIVITNYHGFLRRETVEASKLTKAILAKGLVCRFVDFSSGQSDCRRQYRVACN
jgi:type III restriction enzyme